MPLTATVISDVAEPSGRRRVTYEFDTGTGLTWRKSPRIGAGVDAQADADSRIAQQEQHYRRREKQDAIDRCIAGEDPDTIVLYLVARPKLWEAMTRRLHNGVRNGLSKDRMVGLAQWIVTRSTPAIVDDLPGRTAAQVNALKVQWQALLDAQSVDDYDEIEETD